MRDMGIQRVNYGIFTEKLISQLREAGERPRLLLHACCAPCASYVLEYLADVFDITLFFYNPNISPEEEFTKRLCELKRFCSDAGYANVGIISPEYDPSEFFTRSTGMEDIPEGGERCRLCYEQRLRKTAEYARAAGCDYFCTTLSISPHKRADWLNGLGGALSEEYGVPYLVSDFKKKNGYKRSIELSAQYGLYRQNYCGCVFSMRASAGMER